MLETFEDFKSRYESYPVEHFKVQINLAWQKLDEYYSRLDDAPVYVAALALHPRYKMRWIKKKWQDRPEWITAAEASVEELWAMYKNRELREPVEVQQRETYIEIEQLRESRGLNAYLDKDIFDGDDTIGIITDKLSQWQAITVQADRKVINPIQYWYSNRQRWPRLALMAIDLFRIPAISSEPERVFGNTGDIITSKRNRLHADIVGAGICLKQWDSDGAIDWR